MRCRWGVVVAVVALTGGIWLLPAPSSASTIALYGNDSNLQLETFLEANGHVVTNFGFGVPSPAGLTGIDVMIALRNIQGNVGVFVNNTVLDFVTGGGLLISEWNGSEYVVDTNNLMAADVGANTVFGAQPITFTSAGVARGLATGMNNPFMDGTRSDNQMALSGLGAGVEVLATRPGDIPVMIGAVLGQGYVLVNGLEWADQFGSANADTQTWLLNAVGVAEPASLGLVGVGLALCRRLGRARRRAPAVTGRPGPSPAAPAPQTADRR